MSTAKFPKLLDLAVKMARGNIDRDDYRKAILAAVGQRCDGAIVTAYNASSRIHPREDGEKVPAGHAESRLTKKLDYDSVVAVARVRRDGSVAMSAPCVNCRTIMRNHGVKKVFYTIDENEWGTIHICP